MSFPSLILEFLKNHAEVSVAGFGIFYLKNINALVETDRKSILPPGKEVAFKNTTETSDLDFASFLASQRNISIDEAEAEIKKHVVFWNSTLEKEGTLTVEGIGTFSLNDSKIHFSGARLNNATPDFYGLEEINLADISKRSQQNSGNGKPYRVSTSWFWLTALIIAVAAISYLGISQPEEIFGKKSFAKPLEEQPRPKASVKAVSTDSTLARKAADSTKTDSVSVSGGAARSFKNK